MTEKEVYDQLHNTAMRAHLIAKGVTILIRHETRDAHAAADIIMDELVRLTGELNHGLDSAKRP